MALLSFDKVDLHPLSDGFTTSNIIDEAVLTTTPGDGFTTSISTSSGIKTLDVSDQVLLNEEDQTPNGFELSTPGEELLTNDSLAGIQTSNSGENQTPNGLELLCDNSTAVTNDSLGGTDLLTIDEYISGGNTSQSSYVCICYFLNN